MNNYFMAVALNLLVDGIKTKTVDCQWAEQDNSAIIVVEFDAPMAAGLLPLLQTFEKKIVALDPENNAEILKFCVESLEFLGGRFRVTVNFTFETK